MLRRGQTDCLEVRKASSEFLEGELSPSRLQKIRSHLDGCAPCRAFIDGLARTVRMLGQLPRQNTPTSLKQSIKEKIREKGTGGSAP